MSNHFYRAFEDKFRGSRDLILDRLGAYRPFISPIKGHTNQPVGIDLGCGRGEWLQLLASEGIQAKGIDLDAGMLAACRELGLEVTQGEAIAFLKALPDASAHVISAFHVVEHISFEDLQTLVAESHRVLAPGGILIMETPNPENIQVATHTFYYDPTHVKPIPPLLLGFLPEFFGYARAKIIRLQQNPVLEASDAPSLMEVFGGASPDYAVIAQKDAPGELLKLFEQAFSADYGLPLPVLANRYDEAIKRQSQQTRAIATGAEASAGRAEVAAQGSIDMAAKALRQATQSLATSDAVQALVQGQLHQLHHHLHRLEGELAHAYALNANANQRIIALLDSTSWKVTAPLRWLSLLTRRLLTPPVVAFMHFVGQRPYLREPLLKVLKRVPGLAHRLHVMAINRGLAPAPELDTVKAVFDPAAGTAAQPMAKPLDAHAGRLYRELRTVIDSQSKDQQEK